MNPNANWAFIMCQGDFYLLYNIPGVDCYHYVCFTGGETECTGSLGDLPKVTQLISGKAEI